MNQKALTAPQTARNRGRNTTHQHTLREWNSERMKERRKEIMKE
ncbi:hypothetical protein [Rossellomorea sp. BNER]|jgi:hypothetical protein